MNKKTGGGAALFAGADFQARIGAYALISVLTSTPCSLFRGQLTSISFETGEAIDDLLLTSTEASTYIQAKRSLSFSKAKESAFMSSLAQFVAQEACSADRLVLATTSRSSKKITRDLKTALDRFRGADRARFDKDQPQSIISIIDDFLGLLIDNLGCDPDRAERIARNAEVAVIDIETGDPHASGLELMLEASNYKPGAAFFGKIVADCVSFAKERRTVDLETYVNTIAFLRPTDQDSAQDRAANLFNIIQQGELSVGREILLCSLPNDTALPVDTAGPVLFEIYRFDENCSERLVFDEDTVTFLDGTIYPLHARCSSFVGMDRLLHQTPDLIGDHELVVLGINADEDFEATDCAAIHKKRLSAALESNKSPLACLRCAESISTNDAHLVEIGAYTAPSVGFIHPICRKPSDRIIGAVQSSLFDDIVDLDTFDVEGWYKAIENGQRAFHNAEYIAPGQPRSIAWGGFAPKPPLGGFMIEIALKDGSSEIVTERNQVHRFTRDEGESFCEHLNSQFESARLAKDPFCYTDQSKAFGLKSQLIKQLGFSEKTREIDSATLRKFDALIAEQFELPGQWYTPVFYLTDDDGQPIEFQGGVFLLTDPLKASEFIENWKHTFDLPKVIRTRILYTDDEFDEFNRWCCMQELSVLVDPIVQNEPLRLVSGMHVVPLEYLLQSNSESSEKFTTD